MSSGKSNMIIILLCFKWDDAYEKEIFKYPWDVVTFVSRGDRLAKPNEIPETIFSIIAQCWSASASDRPGLSCFFSHAEISQVVQMLDTVN